MEGPENALHMGADGRLAHRTLTSPSAKAGQRRHGHRECTLSALCVVALSPLREAILLLPHPSEGCGMGGRDNTGNIDRQCDPDAGSRGEITAQEPAEKIQRCLPRRQHGCL